MRKHAFSVSDKVRHKPGCATIEGGYRYKISTLEKFDGLYYKYMYLGSENKRADQLRSAFDIANE